MFGGGRLRRMLDQSRGGCVAADHFSLADEEGYLRGVNPGIKARIESISSAHAGRLRAGSFSAKDRLVEPERRRND